MLTKGTINAFQKILPKFRFQAPSSFSEDFAQKRYYKKMEVPSSDHVDLLARECWGEWISNDEGLPDIQLPPGSWYKARLFLHRNMLPVRFDQIEFPKGTEFDPTRGQNSIEARLSASRWTCTSDNFSRMAEVCYRHKALKRAVRNRYTSWFSQRNFGITERQADQYLYTRFKHLGNDAGQHIFSWKLSRVCKITNGSRFSTVPKNNEKRRPINIEPFGNILTQRAVGNYLRGEVNRLFSVDLNTLQDRHRQRIKHVDDIATIDLKNASDSISIDLCKFLLPTNVMNALYETRSEFVLGPDGKYYMPRKISSMGNGFTFELMTLILTAVCRQLDPEATVFGDDIIIRKDKAEELMQLLSAVGLKVNVDKSFADGPFRESCGGNYHKEEGYIESYDFQYPVTIGDCVMIWNKVVRLATVYESFSTLKRLLFRSLPLSLRGGPSSQFLSCDALELKRSWNKDEDSGIDFPAYFVTDEVGGDPIVNPKIKACLLSFNYEPSDFRMVQGFEFKSDLRSQTLKHLSNRRHWAKYEMYLAGGRRTKDVLTDKGQWASVWFVNSETTSIRVSSLDLLNQ